MNRFIMAFELEEDCTDLLYSLDALMKTKAPNAKYKITRILIEEEEDANNNSG